MLASAFKAMLRAKHPELPADLLDRVLTNHHGRGTVYLGAYAYVRAHAADLVRLGLLKEQWVCMEDDDNYFYVQLGEAREALDAGEIYHPGTGDRIGIDRLRAIYESTPLLDELAAGEKNAETLHQTGLLAICQRLHMSATGAGERLTDDVRASYMDHLRSRIALWKPSKPFGEYDDAVLALCKAALDEAATSIEAKP